MSTAAPYVSLVTLYTYAPNTQMVYSSILQGLLSKETELKAQQAENVRTTELLRAHLATATGVALVAAVKGKRSRQLVEKHNCTGCGKFVYHTLENCWTLHPEKREQHSNKAERKREGKRTRHSDSDSDVDDGTRRAARPFTSSGQPRASKRRSHHQSSDQSVERVLLTHTMVDQPTSQSLIRVSAKAFPAVVRSNTLTDKANGGWYPSSGAISQPLIRTSAKAFPAVVRSNTLTDKANGGWYPSSGAISESLIRVSGKAFPTAQTIRSNTLSDSAIRIWYLDSGATKHICAQSDQMLDYMSNAPEHVLGIGSQPFPVHGSGNLALWWLFERGQHKMLGLIRDVLHVPNANCNLLSVGQLQNAGFCVTFDRHDDVAMLEDANGSVWETSTDVLIASTPSAPHHVSRCSHSHSCYCTYYVHCDNDYYTRCQCAALARPSRTPWCRANDAPTEPLYGGRHRPDVNHLIRPYAVLRFVSCRQIPPL